MTDEQRRRAIFAITTVVFIDALGFSLVIPFLPLYASRSFGASSLMVAAIVATFGVFQLFAAPVLGRLSDIHGRRPVLLLTLVGSAVGFLLLAAAQWVSDALLARELAGGPMAGLVLLFLARAVNGITGGNMPVAQAYLADVTSPDNRAWAMGLVSTAFVAALGVGPLLAGELSLGGRFVLPALLGAAVSRAGAVACWALLPENAAPAGRRAAGADGAPEADAERPPGARLAEVVAALRDRRTGLLLVQWFLFILCFAMFAHMFPLIAGNEFDLDERQIGYLLAFLALLAVAWQAFVLGPLSMRLRDQRLAAFGLTAFLASFLFLPAYEAVSPTRTLAWIVGVMLLFGIGFAAARPAITSALTKAVPDDQAGGIMGVAQSLDSLATVVGPLLTGWVLKVSGLRELGATAAALCAVALAVAWLGRRT
jgi:DHA1 family tetracycline resistance protein-like MFS transporter